MRVSQGILHREFISCWSKVGNVKFQPKKAQTSCWYLRQTLYGQNIWLSSFGEISKTKSK